MSDHGLVNVSSPYSVDETLKRLQTVLANRGVQIFALVDHSGEAAKAGMTMPPTKLLIFGNPKAGTPLMLASPSVAIDLPLKALVWQDGNGKVSITYNSPEYLRDRHTIPDELVKNISVVGGLVAKALE